MLERLKQRVSLGGGFALLLLGLYLACTPEPTQVRLEPNQPPETIITGAPLDSSNAFHRYHLFWYGADPDGQVVEYWVAVADSNIAPQFSDYRRTVATDTVIEFVANNDVVLAHSFWVYAVDNEAQRDETPARIYFNAVDVNRPVPIITRAIKRVVNDPDTSLAFNDTIPSAGSCVRFTWTAFDPDLGGSIRSYRIKLSTDNAFTEIPADSTAVTYCNLPSGIYDFLLEAVDNAGAESLAPAVWSWSVNHEPDTRITGMFVNGQPVDFGPGQVAGTPCAWPEGVPTIRDSSRVILTFAGSDIDGTVTGFSYRILRIDIVRCSIRRPGFTLPTAETAISLPVPTLSNPDTSRVFFTSNDYEVVIRSHDNEGKADGTPTSVKFHANFAPVLRPSGVFPGPGAVVDSSETAVNDTLVVRFTAEDVETPPRDLSYRTVLDGRYGFVVGPNIPADSLLVQRWPFPAVGEHSLRYFVTDPGRRADTLDVVFTVVP